MCDFDLKVMIRARHLILAQGFGRDTGLGREFFEFEAKRKLTIWSSFGWLSLGSWGKLISRLLVCGQEESGSIGKFTGQTKIANSASPATFVMRL